MKKVSITLGVVFCIFILCSLTYQPIVANESNDNINQDKINDKSKWYPHLRCYILKKWVNRIGWWMDIIYYIFPFLDELWSILKDIRLTIWDRFYEIGCNWNELNDYNDCGCDDKEEPLWDFPITCAILESLAIKLKSNAPWPEPPLYSILIELVYFFGLIFNCDWAKQTL